MHVTVVGSGYVGLVAAACFAEIGHEVVCVDKDQQRIRRLESGEVPIFERYLPELLARHRGRRLRFSAHLFPAAQLSDAVFIAVGTPAGDDGRADLSSVEGVCRELAATLRGRKVVVEKSTVPLFTSEWVRNCFVDSEAMVHVVSNPEFLREGSAVTDFLYPDRIVIGADSEYAASFMNSLYQPLVEGTYGSEASAVPPPPRARVPAKMVVTSTRSAEMIKHVSNAFLAMKISFINSVAQICEAAGADIGEVVEGVGADSRIGRRFLRAGIGFGGSCFPKDLKAFRAVAAELGCAMPMLDEVSRVNERQRHAFLEKVQKAVGSLAGKRIAALGLAFKGGTDDVRHSPAVAIVSELLRAGASVTAFDPAAMASAARILPPGRLRFAADAYDCARHADALVLLTDWEEFCALDLAKLRRAMASPVVVDGRNLFSPEAMAAEGFFYSSVGRGDAQPELEVSEAADNAA